MSKEAHAACRQHGTWGEAISTAQKGWLEHVMRHQDSQVARMLQFHPAEWLRSRRLEAYPARWGIATGTRTGATGRVQGRWGECYCERVDANCQWVI